MNPYYEDESVTLFHADNREYFDLIGMGLYIPPVFDLTLTDPPYNEVNRESNGLANLDRGGADSEPVDIPDVAEQLAHLTSGSIYIWCGFRQLSKWLDEFVARDLSVRGGVWHKTNVSPMNAQHIWTSGLEAVAFARKPKAYFNRGVGPLYFHGRSTPMVDVHPTAKPLWLFEEIIQTSCPPSGTVFDPYAGIGTTLEAAKKHGRKAVGIELEEKYCEVAAKRLSQGTLF